MGQSNIILDGVEVSIIKALGFGGGEISGEVLLDRVSDLEIAEVIHALEGLVMMGYVIADKMSFNSSDDFRKTNFHVNSGYARELKEAMDPNQQKPQTRRVRRE